MSDHADDLCPRPIERPARRNVPHADPIQLASVYRCDDPEQAAAMLAGAAAGYVYQRDGHPNADALAEKCRLLHGAERAAIAASGMSALALALVALVKQGDHVLLSDRLYGRTTQLFVREAGRFGVATSTVDVSDRNAMRAALLPNTRLVVVETISNPTLRVADLAALAEIASARGAALLVDNTFASPALCRPLEWGAHLVHESLTKIMNGHSDVILGLLCGQARLWERVPDVLSCWGWTAAPFECWLAGRGLATLHLRSERACANALAAAEFLAGRADVARVDYPGLESHPDHALARRQFGDRFGAMVTFHLQGGRAAAEGFIRRAEQIPFCPSLGELSTTLSHPESTSHRGLSPENRAALGIDGGSIRLSVGTESREFVLAALAQGLGR